MKLYFRIYFEDKTVCIDKEYEYKDGKLTVTLLPHESFAAKWRQV